MGIRSVLQYMLYFYVNTKNTNPIRFLSMKVEKDAVLQKLEERSYATPRYRVACSE